MVYNANYVILPYDSTMLLSIAYLAAFSLYTFLICCLYDLPDLLNEGLALAF